MPILRWMRQTDEIDPFRLQSFTPRQHMLIDAVDERAVQVEEESGLLAFCELDHGAPRIVSQPSDGPEIDDFRPGFICAWYYLLPKLKPNRRENVRVFASDSSSASSRSVKPWS